MLLSRSCRLVPSSDLLGVVCPMAWLWAELRWLLNGSVLGRNTLCPPTRLTLKFSISDMLDEINYWGYMLTHSCCVRRYYSRYFFLTNRFNFNIWNRKVDHWKDNVSFRTFHPFVGIVSNFWNSNLRFIVPNSGDTSAAIVESNQTRQDFKVVSLLQPREHKPPRNFRQTAHIIGQSD